MHTRDFPYADGQPLSGIIAYLTDKFGGNLHEKGIVLMSASSIALDACPARRKFMFDEIDRIFADSHLPIREDSQITRNPSWGPDQALDFGKMTSFNSMNKPNQWIIWDFKDLQICPTGYTIQSGFWNFPKSWVVEGSKDGVNYVELDSQVDNEEVKKCIGAVTIQIQNSELFRYLRVTQGAKNHTGSDHLVISAFEVFGSLVAPFELPDLEK
jgi:hypothetical protein